MGGRSEGRRWISVLEGQKSGGIAEVSEGAVAADQVRPGSLMNELK